MGVYQKFRGDPENKLFFLLSNFMGGINTEFSDDNSDDIDFESIINFDMDKLGTLTKRGGFGKLTAISEIFNKLQSIELPNIKNRNKDNTNPENENDNVVYMKLLRDDNKCFRALSGFTGENAYRKYQEMFGFQNNQFTLLLITTKLTDGVVSSSNAWLYKCSLPELAYDENEDVVDTMTITCYKLELPIQFNWDRNLMNIETIEFYDKIYFTGNNKCLLSFDRAAEITDDTSFANAFSYSGFSSHIISYICVGIETGSYWFTYEGTNYQFTMPTIEENDILVFDGTELKLNNETTVATTTGNSGTELTMSTVVNVQNSAYIPSGLEIRHIGFNVLAEDPIHAINTPAELLSVDSFQGVYLCTLDNIPLQNIPLGQKFLLNIMYTGSDNGFTIEMKEGENDISFDSLANTTLSRNGLKVYEITFKDVPSSTVEIKITKTGATLEPYYDYLDIANVDVEAKPVAQLNVGDYGLVEMYNRAVLYKGDTIWFSEVNNFKYIPNYNWITIPIEPTDEITKICYFKKSYIVFTKQRIYKMTGSFGTNDFAISPVNMALGCHAGNTVAPIGDTLYFASNRGLYALKSSTFVEGYENVKELDIKVKKLTSDFTKYDEELNNPAIRYNGISERAYATRYKDKYLLFYNNYGDKGDYAAANDLDVLAYQFDIGAYTTYRFNEKPTFLFMVDNAIETFSTVLQKQDYTEPEVLLNYDLTSVSDGVVEDTSVNNLDGNLKGSCSVNECVALNSQSGGGAFSHMSIDYNSIFDNLSEGRILEIDTKLDIEDTSGYLFYTRANSSYGNIKGEIIQDYTSYATTALKKPLKDSSTKFSYDITYNNQTQNLIVNYKLYFSYNPNNISVVPSQLQQYFWGLAYNLNIGDETVLSIPLTDFTAAPGLDGTNNSILVSTGSFTISYDNTIDYNADWKLFSQVILHKYNTSPIFQITNQTIKNIEIPVMRNSIHDIGLSRNNKILRFVLHGAFGNFSLSSGNISDIDDRHVWGFSLIPNNDGYEVNILKDGVSIKQGLITDKKIIEDIERDVCLIGGGLGSAVQSMFFYNFTVKNVDNEILESFSCTDLVGTEIPSKVSGSKIIINPTYVTPIINQGVTFKGGYLEIPAIANTHRFSNGFKIEFEGVLGGNSEKVRVLDLATSYNNNNSQDKNCSINISVQNNVLELRTTGINYKTYYYKISTIDLTENHSFVISVVDNGKGYTIYFAVDNIQQITYVFREYGGITNINRFSNFIGKSNTTTEPNFKGILKSFKISIYKSLNPVDIYETAIYEFDTTPTDFEKPMCIELKTKGINMKYPQHLKKLKHIFVKAIGGYNYGEMFFTLYGDGYIVNDPEIYDYSVDEDTGVVVQTYKEVKNLTIDERMSLLGNMRLDKTKLGEGKYQTRKLVIPEKARNFTILTYGESGDYISIESFGFVCKLGKVKEG